ncbi:hypothetical protein [Holdemanella sp.]|uniref:hypothetical protein n=1 Tax=Holdemanella sp. TaxID=1971762 RepID=UPI003AF1C2C9
MAFSPDTRGRSWFVTIHEKNMKKSGMSKEQYMNPEFVADRFLTEWEKSGKGRIGAIAVCESAQGLYHLHMACYGNTTTLKKVSDVLFQSHVEPVKGKSQLLQYLTKEGKYAEKGEKVLYTKNLEVIEDNQGKRSDLDVIEEMLNDGATPEEIFETSFRYRKYEKMVKSDYLARRIKETPLVKNMWNEYHWGRSGSGKTYTYIKLCEKYPDEVYLCNDYANSGTSGGGFDFYSSNPARIVILDEFRGNIPYAQLLSMLDVYSRNQQHCRYQNVYNLWTSVVICSIYPPEKVYSFMVDDTQKSVDSIQQLLRRLKVIVYHYINKDGKYRAFRMPAKDYINASDMIERAKAYEKIADEVEAMEELTNNRNLSVEEFMKTWDVVKVKE